MMRVVHAAFRALTRKDKAFFLAFLAMFIAGVVWGGVSFVSSRTMLVPAAGGSIIEGVVGMPRYINPLIADTNDAEGALEALIFSSLFRVTTDGGIEPDLAESYEISENGKEYFVTLRENLKWHDGEPLTLDDVLFTLNLIQNPSIRSPLASAWQRIGIERMSERTVKFILENPYGPFLETLTFRILPRHIWAQIPIENFFLSDQNLKPIGSGPYKFRLLQKEEESGTITAYTLVANPLYHHSGSYIQTVKLRFFKTPDEAFLALKKGGITNLGGISYEHVGTLDISTLNVFRILIPSVYGVFFNTESTFLKDARIREALERSIDRNEVVNRILKGEAVVLVGPIPSGFGVAFPENASATIDVAAANELLDKAGWSSKDEDGIRTKKLSSRAKSPTRLELTLVIPASPDHERIAEFLQASWKNVGASIAIQKLDAAEISQALRSRVYDMMLFGTRYTQEPDLFPFWHSSQETYPGLNLSRYGNKKVDTLIEAARRAQSLDVRLQKLAEAQDLILRDHPALFLYTPYYIYAVASYVTLPVTPKIMNTPEERFAKVNEWFIATKRVWKK